MYPRSILIEQVDTEHHQLLIPFQKPMTVNQLPQMQEHKGDAFQGPLTWIVERHQLQLRRGI